MNAKRFTHPAAAAAAAALLSLSGAVSTASADGYVIGVSNTITGNGWREEMICSIKAQALVSGKVESLNIQHRNTDAAGQLEDIRNLVAAGVDAVIVNPAGPDAVNAAIKDATNAGIPVVVVDQAVTEPSAYLLANNQEEYAYLGARWLVEAIGGAGKVVYMGGAAGAPADNDRRNGFDRAIAETNGAVEVAAETQTGWDQATGVQQINDIFASGLAFDGVWTSGIDNVIVDAFKDRAIYDLPQLSSCGPIEAPGGRGGQCWPCGLPQLSSCGPIEALCAFCSDALAWSAFRNCQVAAPLKRGQAPEGRGRAVRLPQLSSCGPIEAGGRRPSRRDECAFRNCQVAAPLKQQPAEAERDQERPSATVKLRPH